MDLCMYALSDEFSRRVAEHCCSGGVDKRGMALDVHSKDAFVNRAQNQAKALFAGCERGGLFLRLLKEFSGCKIAIKDLEIQGRRGEQRFDECVLLLGY